MSRLLTYESNGYRAIDCPQCRQEVRVDLYGDRLGYSCRGQCGADIPALVDEDELREELRELGDRPNGKPETVARELTTLLGLDRVGLSVTGARVVGRGSRASADLYLSDGSTVTFDSLRDFANSTRLEVEIVACTGATPSLTKRKAHRATALLCELAEHQETFTADEIARDWAVSYLQAADRLDLDMDDQAARWAAFERLNRHDPWAEARERGSSLAHTAIVLVHLDGTRFVRTSWFYAYARSQDARAGGNAEIAQRMERVGWHRRGTLGRIKATRPELPGQLAWSFFDVAASWEDDR
jgi:hypothetical protein